MKDTIADALQKIAAGGRSVGSAAAPQSLEITAGPALTAVAAEVLLPQAPMDNLAIKIVWHNWRMN